MGRRTLCTRFVCRFVFPSLSPLCRSSHSPALLLPLWLPWASFSLSLFVCVCVFVCVYVCVCVWSRCPHRHPSDRPPLGWPLHDVCRASFVLLRYSGSLRRWSGRHFPFPSSLLVGTCCWWWRGIHDFFVSPPPLFFPSSRHCAVSLAPGLLAPCALGLATLVALFSNALRAGARARAASQVCMPLRCPPHTRTHNPPPDKEREREGKHQENIKKSVLLNQ